MPYYLYDGKASIGPFEPAELASRPGFELKTLVFPLGATTADAWKPAETFLEIVAAVRLVAPPPPPPQPPAPAPAPAAPALAALPDSTPTGFTLNLPPHKKFEADPASAAPAEADAAPVAAAPAAAAPAEKIEEFVPKLAAPADKLVLVVDDDENVRSFIEMSAKLQGFQVVTAVNGLDATAKLAEKPADLIVTDLMMPGQGGYEFLRSLQGTSGTRVPVFVVTGSALDDSTVAMIKQEANVVEFVPKPIRVAVFVGALHKHLRTAPPP
jgi:CheY-like chemotaxis protein